MGGQPAPKPFTHYQLPDGTHVRTLGAPMLVNDEGVLVYPTDGGNPQRVPADQLTELGPDNTP